MELIQTIQGAIEYMEAHITEPITYATSQNRCTCPAFIFTGCSAWSPA